MTNTSAPEATAMSSFFDALVQPDIPFMRYALLVGVLGSVAFGVVGTYVVSRRISYLAGAISHSILGGVGAALYLREVHGLAWCHPMLGAVVAALAAAVLVGLASLWAGQREDSVIGAIWVVGMAVGLLFFAKLPSGFDPMSYLFGYVVLVTRQDLWIVVGLDALVVGLAVLLHNRFLAVCFDEEFARLRGIASRGYYLLLLCLTALTIVLLVRVVGIVLVIALLTLPAATAGQFARRLGPMMLLAGLFCMTAVVLGLGISYEHSLPTGPTIVLLAGAVYLAVVAGGRLRSAVRPGVMSKNNGTEIVP
ncbi:MAG: metal ABC transporter permease [Pirellulales bacterium]|nr:metal ABC transporter permease [Pirellulales bacterium]